MSNPNEYYFGSDLLVLPVTSPRLSGLNVAKEKLYLPDGFGTTSSQSVYIAETVNWISIARWIRFLCLPRLVRFCR